MLTGDNERTAGAIAEKLGIDEHHASLLPEDKAEAIKQLKKVGIVAIVSNGINDAPAMASAGIGIAMGAAGTDLNMIGYAIGLSRKTLGIIMENTAVVLLLVARALFKSAVLASGMFIHEASIFIVNINGMRLLRYGEVKLNDVKSSGTAAIHRFYYQ